MAMAPYCRVDNKFDKTVDVLILVEKIKVINGNIKDLMNVSEVYDTVVTNPPYMKLDTGLQNENEKKRFLFLFTTIIKK